MIYDYVVTLKNNSARFIDRFSLWLLAISFTLFVLEQANNPHQLKLACMLGVLAIAFILVRNYLLLSRSTRPRTVYYSSALFIAAIVWVTMPYPQPWLFLPFAFLGIFERQAKRPLEIGFSDDSIVINTLIRRRYTWSDFNNIVLKDDLLTLDFKNNRLLQRETLDEDGDADEDEFNDYCRQQLAGQWETEKQRNEKPRNEKGG